jgi:hypothetical protein
MSRRVRSAVATLFALLLVIQAPVASAAMQRDREPSFVQRVIKNIKKVLKPLGVSSNEDDSYLPTPPRP